MTLIHVAAGVLNQTPLDWDGNQSRILEAIRQARAAGVHVLCLPELCISGYGCEDAFFAPDVPRMAAQVLREILPHTGGLIVALGLPVRYEGALYNAAALAVDGRLAGLVAKQHLAGEGIHYEPRWFRPWPAGRQAAVELDGQACPLGDLHFDCGGVAIGFEICEDAWVADRPARRLAARGVELILNPSASHFAFGKTKVREHLVMEAAAGLGVAYVFANLVGNEAGRAIYDGTALVACGERLLAVGPRFSMRDVLLTSAVIDLAAVRGAARGSAVEAGTQPGRVAAPFTFAPVEPRAASVAPHAASGEPRAASIEPDAASAAPPDWEHGPYVKHEEFARAVPLALFDYLRKSRARGLVVSLSGGADSAATACLVGLMVEHGVGELGIEGFLARLDYIADLDQARTPRDLVRRLLTCVYQSTRNSTDVTRNAARAVAEALGAEFHELDVDPIVERYVDLVAGAVGRELTWDSDDLALQNIQARARAPGVWMLANLRGALLLATSNRSEAAVGYTTMDGDTAGGLSPIAGVDKAFLRQWLVWMQDRGPQGVGSLPALAAVTAQVPTAELRPVERRQTDEADLMPYDVLDAIERAAIRDKLAPVEVFERIASEFSAYGAGQLGEWIERFFRLWCRNQWKRERYAPSFHLDDENLDPKTWCRFPILSGGYERELAALGEHVARRSG